MSKMKLYFADYSTYHKHPLNQVTHFIGIPLIMITFLGLLSGIELGLPGLNLGWVLWLCASIWYLTLDPQLGLSFSAVVLGLYGIGFHLAESHRTLTWGMFIAGWILQGVGHYVYEKQSPAFYKNIEHLLIGPFWVFAKLCRQSHRFHER